VLVPIASGFVTTVVTIEDASPKNVTFSVASVRPAADEIVTVPRPDEPSANTCTASPARTVIARPCAVYVSGIASRLSQRPIPSVPAPAIVAV